MPPDITDSGTGGPVLAVPTMAVLEHEMLSDDIGEALVDAIQPLDRCPVAAMALRIEFRDTHASTPFSDHDPRSAPLIAGFGQC
jgi:hypothetical protein